MGKIGNVLTMLKILENGQKYTVKELAERLEVSKRMIKIYKSELEKAGIYIETLYGPYGGYVYNHKNNYDIEFNFSDIDNIENNTPIPYCDECDGLVKPDVVLYEEGLDNDTVNGALNAISNADCLIIAGTSLTVYPAASFVRYFRGKYLVLINRDETAMDKNADLVIHDKVGEVLSKIKVK